MMKNEISERAGHEANARPIENGTQEDKKVLFDCPQAGAASDCALCPIETKSQCIPTKPAPAALPNTYDNLEFALKEKGYWTPADERRPAKDAKMEIPAVIDADSIQAQAEARIRGNVA